MAKQKIKIEFDEKQLKKIHDVAATGTSFNYDGLMGSYHIEQDGEVGVDGPISVCGWYYYCSCEIGKDFHSNNFASLKDLLRSIIKKEMKIWAERRESMKVWIELPEKNVEEVLNIILENMKTNQCSDDDISGVPVGRIAADDLLRMLR